MLKENHVLHEFDSVVKSFSKKDKIALCHDLDADGISSGVIAYHAIRLLRGKKPDLVITQPFKTVELLPGSIELLRKKKITKLVVVDFALDQKFESIQAAEKILDKILVIDHHKFYDYKTNPTTFIVKPQFVSAIEPSKYPCAKFCYDLFSRHTDLGGFSWIACAGLMGDNQLAQWRGFVKTQAKKHKSSVAQIWKVTQLISAVEVLAPKKFNELLFFLTRAKSPKKVLSSKYKTYTKKLSSGVNKLMKKFRKDRRIYQEIDLIWFEFETDSNFKSVLINKVSNELYPNKTIIFVQKKNDGFVSFSARRQDFKVKTNDLLEKAVAGFENAGAGGHIPASAGRILEKDLPEFKKRIIGLLSKRANG